MSDVLDLYENGFSVKNQTFQLILKGKVWEHRSWEQENQFKGHVFHVITTTNHFLVLLRENNYTIQVQDATEFFMQHSLSFTTFDILKKHIFELCNKK